MSLKPKLKKQKSKKQLNLI